MRKFLLQLVLLIGFVNGFAQNHRDSVDVCHYNLILNMVNAPNGFISGEAELSIKFNYNASSFALDLYKLTADSVLINNKAVNFSLSDTLLRINASVNSTDTFLVKVFYQGRPEADNRWGGFFYNGTQAFNIGVGMGSYPHGIGRFWYPCIDSFTDRATYEFQLTTSIVNKAVAPGLLINEVNGLDSNFYHWKLDKTIPTYLSSIAVGPYIVITDVYNGIENDIPIEIYTLKADSLATIKTFSKLKETLAVFENKFGPYLWPRVGYVVVPFSSGAMEHATNIAFPANALGDKISTYNLVAHELAHHWFGNLITCSTSADMWLNEGWASYCENIFKEGVFSYEMGVSHILNNQISVIKSAHKADGGYFALNKIPKEITYGSTVYDKGALVTHCLRTFLGDDKFYEGITQFLNQNKYSSISSEYLQQQLSEITGENLESFFDNWVYQPGYPHYSVGHFNATNVGSAYNVEVQMVQKLKARNFYSLNNKVELLFVDANYKTKDTIISFSGESETFSFELPFKPVAVFADPNNMVLDPITTDQHYISEPGYMNFDNCDFKINTQNVSDSAIIRVQYNWIKADSIKNSIQGLGISNYHYWKVQGVFPEDFKTEGKFSYNFAHNTNADDGYEHGTTDTVVLVYRADNLSDWQVIQKIESARIITSYTWIKDLQPGEYALAIWDGLSSMGMNFSLPENQKPVIYPNPVSDSFSIKMPFNFSGTIEVFGVHGKKYIEKEIYDQNEIWILENSLPSGIFFVKSYGTINTTIKGIKK